MANEALTNQEMVEMVMQKIEEFYFDDGPESGEAIFNSFAAKHEHVFDDDMDATGQE